MITGFNTDVEYNGVTYHVQTEDKGIETPLILSLVYNRGTILASKRSPYNDLLLGTFNEKELSERLNRQHKLICAAIRAGRIEDLKRMNSKAHQPQIENKEPEAVKIEPKPQIDSVNVGGSLLIPKVSTPSIEFSPIADSLLDLDGDSKANSPSISKPIPDLPFQESKEKLVPGYDAPIEITDADLIFDDTQNLDEVIVLSDEAVEIVNDFFDDFETDNNKINIQLIKEVEFRSGEHKTVSILVNRGKSYNTISGATMIVKILGSNFRPLILHTKTDSNGVAIVNIQVPQFSRGRAAVLFKVIDNGDEAEIRRVIQPI